MNPYIHLSVHLLLIYPSIHLSICPSIAHLSIHTSIYLSIYCSSIYPYIYLSVHLLLIYLSIHLSICPSIVHLSIHIHLFISIHISIIPKQATLVSYEMWHLLRYQAINLLGPICKGRQLHIITVKIYKLFTVKYIYIFIYML